MDEALIIGFYAFIYIYACEREVDMWNLEARNLHCGLVILFVLQVGRWRWDPLEPFWFLG